MIQKNKIKENLKNEILGDEKTTIKLRKKILWKLKDLKGEDKTYEEVIIELLELKKKI